ncbi:MAG: hypothetical protein ABIT01_16180 [Thermoanaerobaculia bacterium]
MEERSETTDENGSSEESWSGVEAVANESEAAIVVGFLQNHDIPARVMDKSFHQTPTTDEDLNVIEVAVPTPRLEEARRVLLARDVAFEASPEGSDTLLTDEGLKTVDPETGGEG